jgi:hypothetical protein
MDIDIDELTRSLLRLVLVQSEYNKAFEEYEGYSWDWAGGHIIEELSDAKKDFKKLMDGYIDQRVEAKIREYDLNEYQN